MLGTVQIHPWDTLNSRNTGGFFGHRELSEKERAMRFEFYHDGLDNVPKLSVDGIVPNSIHFSHWEGNKTPAAVKADTSTEIALNLVASPNHRELTRRIELVTNNHFDTDGVLSVWTVLMGERALDLGARLIAAAEVGDFCEFPSDNAVRASIVIQGADQASSSKQTPSPLASQLASVPLIDDARAYELVLPKVEDVLKRTDSYEPLWRDAWEQIVRAVESFERGGSRVEESTDISLSLVNVSPDIFGATAVDLRAIPNVVISRYASGQLYLIAIPVSGAWLYRIDYPYYSWAETVVRPPIPKLDFGLTLRLLNEIEQTAGARWRTDTSEMTSAVKCLGADGRTALSSLAPQAMVHLLRAQLTAQRSATGAQA
jgi:Family of unknown function (DUF6687)